MKKKSIETGKGKGALRGCVSLLKDETDKERKKVEALQRVLTNAWRSNYRSLR